MTGIVKAVLVFLAVALAGGMCSADGRYDMYSYRRPDSWAGEKFVFHPKPRNLRMFKYNNMTREGANGDITSGIHPSYEECAGVTVTVTEVRPALDGEYTVYLKAADGTVYRAITSGGSVDGLVSLTDIDNARDKFEGRKLWYRHENMLSYNEETGGYEAVYAPRDAYIRVARIEPGWDTKTPVRFVLDNGHSQEGYVEVNLSGTNVPASARGRNRLWDFFSEKRPQDLPEKVRGFIEKNMVIPGMKREEVYMSWGPPLEVTDGAAGKEKWFYPYGDCVYFEGDTVERTGKEEVPGI